MSHVGPYLQLEGSLVRSSRCRSAQPTTPLGAEEDRSSYASTLLPRADAIGEYLTGQFERVAQGSFVCQIRRATVRAVGCTAYWNPRYVGRPQGSVCRSNSPSLARRLSAQRLASTPRRNSFLMSYAFERLPGGAKSILKTDARTCDQTSIEVSAPRSREYCAAGRCRGHQAKRVYSGTRRCTRDASEWSAVKDRLVERDASVPSPVERLSRVSTKRSLTALHSEAIGSTPPSPGVRPSSPGAQRHRPAAQYSLERGAEKLRSHVVIARCGRRFEIDSRHRRLSKRSSSGGVSPRC